MLKINNLKVSVEKPASTKVSADDKSLVDRPAGKQEILKGIDLEVSSGQLHVLMGPNGSGKSTLAQVIAGAPQFTIDPTSLKLRGASSSSITFNGEDITKLTPDKRAKLGIFLGFQHPVEVPGVSVFNVLRKVAGPTTSDGGRLSLRSHDSSEVKKRRAHLRGVKAHLGGVGLGNFRQELLEYASSLKLSGDFLRRSLNEGFSGGEKKRSEILQMMALKPRLVILDEIDSGLDIDSLKIVADLIYRYIRSNPKASVILITHYARILKYLKPDYVHVMVDGRIVKSGTLKLAHEVETVGYQGFKKEVI